MHPATALVADDEPLLRESLVQQISQVWPELEVVAQARNGREAIDLFDVHQPQVCFLDIHMPGRSGIDVAVHIGRRAHIVFVTAFDHYAVEAFARGALDYLLKPVELERLAETASRLRERLTTAVPAINTEALVAQLAGEIAALGQAKSPLKWIRAQAGQTVRLIPVQDIDYIRADSKYTLIAWRAEDGRPATATIRTTIRELIDQLDADQFAQVHRSVIVNLHSISQVRRHDNETAEIHMKGRPEVLPVSRNYLHIFRQM